MIKSKYKYATKNFQMWNWIGTKKLWKSYFCDKKFNPWIQKKGNKSNYIMQLKIQKQSLITFYCFNCMLKLIFAFHFFKLHALNFLLHVKINILINSSPITCINDFNWMLNIVLFSISFLVTCIYFLATSFN